MSHCTRIASAASAIALGAMLASSAVAGPDWLEGSTDAGGVLSDAQYTFGKGNLRTIAGRLSNGVPTFGGDADYEDMFIISVTDPSKFSITIANADFDAQLFIFNITLADEAFGLLGNQGTMSGVPLLTQFSNDGSGAQLSNPGIYAIAISGLGRAPVSNTGEIFNFTNPFEVSGPDGPGGFNPHSGWTGVGQVGSYVLQLDGTGFYDVPGPGGLAVLAMLLAAPRRRRC